MLAKLTRGNQITIPKEIVRKAGLTMGEHYLDVLYQDGLIFIKPVDLEERIAPEILEKYQINAAKVEQGDIKLTEHQTKNFLARRIKKK